MIDFFTKDQERHIILAIRSAEKDTSGEIRLHLAKEIDGDVKEAAAKVFSRLRMDRTASRNGVLIFLVPSQKKFAIIGDKGINERVPPNFWQDVRDLMQQHFKEGNFTEGVCRGIELAGQKLKEHFPWKHDDKNELSDEISYGDAGQP